jgi:spermidine/putrescine ABC transporter ATP-binding subunit
MSCAEPDTVGVRLQNVSASYRDHVAVKDVSLALPAGEILALLGPSGCGKTTLLRSIAGFVPHAGEIYIGTDRISEVPPHRRNIGMVFQDYALFPHMTAGQNVGFGLRMRGLNRPAICRRVGDVLKLVDLEGFDDRMVRQLSGGQQQRVALARALVIQPSVLLLDEPLSALDKKLREEMRIELKRIQRLTGVTTIFVTHDQDEALALADRLALMQHGRILQVGTPEDVYRRPADSFVATFLGAVNTVNAVCIESRPDFALLEIPGVGSIESGSVVQLAPREKVQIFVRPERVRVQRSNSSEAAGPLSAVVARRTYLGRHFELLLTLQDGTSWTAHTANEDQRLDSGDTVHLEVRPGDVIVFRAKSSTAEAMLTSAS